MKERNYSRKWSEQEDALLLAAINVLELGGKRPNFQQLAASLSKKFGRRYTGKAVYEHFLRLVYQRFLDASLVEEEEFPPHNLGKALKTVARLCEIESRFGNDPKVHVQSYEVKRPPKEKIRGIQVRTSDAQLLTRTANLASCQVHTVISGIIDEVLKKD